MPKSMEEINAEKRTKSRPDLIPAEVYRRYRRMSAERTTGDPLTALLDFAQTGEIEHVFRAMALTAQRTGRRHGNGLAMGRVLAYGLAKHGVCTWRVAGTEQADPQTHYASALRHVLEYYYDNDAVEEGSGFPVLDHALTQMAILADLVLDPPDKPGTNDGRWAIAAARKPVAEPLPPLAEPLPPGYEWARDESQFYQEFIRTSDDTAVRAVWLESDGTLYGSLQRDPRLVAILARRHGVTL